jgi:hypothetical protein
MAYTNEEIKAFALKDLRMSRMNALNRAVEVTIHCDKDNNLVTPAKFKAKCLSLADDFVKYIYEGAKKPYVPSELDKPEDKPLPIQSQIEMTLPQKEVFDSLMLDYCDQVADGYVVDGNLLKGAIIQKFGRYPEQMASKQLIMSRIVVAEVSVSKEDANIPEGL